MLSAENVLLMVFGLISLHEFFFVGFLPFMSLKTAAQFAYFAVTVSVFLNHVVFFLN